MHIPDGYLSPQTCAALSAAMVPIWGVSAVKVREVVKRRDVPLLGIAAAFAFLMMMFNVPIPDGTTAHAVGAVIIAILLGPWAAVIAVSVALAIQALFFGDGGVLAFGANCFNMAFVMSFVGYGVYLLLTRHVSLTSPRRAVAGGVAGYIGLNAAAMFAAFEFGIQPDLFHTADGTPLYAPFHLAQTVPAMAFAHLLVAGVVEFAITAGIITYLQHANLPILRINHPSIPESDRDVAEPARLGWRWAIIGLGALVALTPLGLLAPGGAFGEDGPRDLDLGKYNLQAIPEGLDRYNSFWSHALLNGYGLGDGENATVGYLVSAVSGIVVIGAVILAGFGICRLFVNRRDNSRRKATPATSTP
jgi:cobalt/nickel transport system permease protein